MKYAVHYSLEKTLNVFYFYYFKYWEAESFGVSCNVVGQRMSLMLGSREYAIVNLLIFMLQPISSLWKHCRVSAQVSS